jgi:hypothetical protein
MKIALSIIFVLISMAAVAEPDQVRFDGILYNLVFTDKSDGTTTTEYVREGESLGEWSTLFAVREFQNQSSLKKPIQAVIDSTRQYMALPPEGLPSGGVSTHREMILVLWLVAPDQTYYEYDLYRFIYTGGKVISYQYAQRLPFSKNLDVSREMRVQPQRIDELANMNVTNSKGDGGIKNHPN